MSYRVIVPKTVQKELDNLADEISIRILAKLKTLEANPRPPDVKKLKGRSAWRVRVGDYRIIYEIYDRQLTIILVTIGHRGDVYR